MEIVASDRKYGLLDENGVVTPGEYFKIKKVITTQQFNNNPRKSHLTVYHVEIELKSPMSDTPTTEIGQITFNSDINRITLFVQDHIPSQIISTTPLGGRRRKTRKSKKRGRKTRRR